MVSEHLQHFQEEDLKKNCPISMLLLLTKNTLGSHQKIRSFQQMILLSMNSEQIQSLWLNMPLEFGQDGLLDSLRLYKKEHLFTPYSDSLTLENIMINQNQEIEFYQLLLEQETMNSVLMMLLLMLLLLMPKSHTLNWMDIGIMFMPVIVTSIFMDVFYSEMRIRLNILNQM